MSALSDLQDAAANESQVLNALMADIDDLTAKLGNVPADDSAAIEAIVAQMKQATVTAQTKLAGGSPAADTTPAGTGADTTGGGQTTDTAPPAQASA